MSGGRLSDHDLRARIDARQVFTTLTGEQGKRAGRALQFRSPFRNDGKHGSLTVYADGYKDFGGSGESGDVIDLTARLMGTDRAAAREWLAQFAGGSAAAAAPRQHDQRTAESDPPPMGWQTPVLAAVEQSHRYLMSARHEAQRARAYLYGRGFTDDTLTKYQIGYNAAIRDIWITLPTGEREAVRMSAGIVIPWMAGGALWAVNVRRMSAAADPKYLKVGYAGVGHGAALFGADDLREGQDVLIVEGEIAAMIAAQHLTGVSVITFGSAANARVNPRWRAALASARRIVVCMDADDAGRAGAAKLRAVLPQSAILAALPMGKDADEFIVKHGGDLRGWFDQQVTQPPTSADEPPQADESTQPHESADRRFWAAGVPDSWRTGFLMLKDAPAEVYELITDAARAGLIDPEAFTIREIAAAAAALNRHSPKLEIPIKKLIGVVFPKTRNNIENDSIASPFGKNPRSSAGGRSAIVYELAPLADQRAALLALAGRVIRETSYPVDSADELPPALAQFSALMIRTVIEAADEAHEIAAEIEAASADLYSTPDQDMARARAAAREKTALTRIARALRDTTSTPIDPAWLTDERGAYKVAFLRALAQHRPDEILSKGQKRIARAIGISDQRVGEVLDAAGIRRISGGVETVRIVAPAAHVVKEIKRFAREAFAKPFAVKVTTASGRTDQYTFTPENARAAAERVERDPDARLEVMYQLPNRHEVIADAVPTPRAELRQRSGSGEAAPRPAPAIDDAFDDEARTLTAVEDTGYTPEWVIGQLKLRFVRRGDRLVNPLTGETLAADASPRALIESLIGRKLRTPDKLLLEIASAGGIARVSA